jgi:hypothetical protein
MTDFHLNLPSASELIKQQYEHREELRRDIETHVEPDIRAAHDADKSAKAYAFASGEINIL